MKHWFLLACAVLGLCAAVLAFVVDPFAALFFSIMWSFALGFISPSRSWLAALALSVWAPLGAATHLLAAQPGGIPGCAHASAQPWQIALAVIGASFAFAFAGALCALALNFVLALPALRDVKALRYVKPVLDWGGSALAVALVLYATLAIAQPLQPVALRERYCWDEFCFRVVSVQRVKTLGSGAHNVSAAGTFYVVTADMEAPWWGRFDWSPDAVYVLTWDGGRYEHSVAGQRAIDAVTGNTSVCHMIRGASETETIVFDLPDDVVQPRLLVRDTLGFEGFLGGLRYAGYYVKPGFNLRYD